MRPAVLAAMLGERKGSVLTQSQSIWHNPGFRAYLGSTGFSGMALAMQQLLLSWMLIGILQLPADQVGLLQAIIGIPGVLLMLMGGASADRSDPREMLIKVYFIAPILPIFLIFMEMYQWLGVATVTIWGLGMSVVQSYSMPGQQAILNRITRSSVQQGVTAATAIGFLRQYGLDQDFKLNIEVNHATLAQHSFEHELAVAAHAGMLGSIDANRGDNQNGWDTDQFPVNLYEVTEAMLVFLQAGGLQGGGVNFDAKIRRNSTDIDDIFHAHIGGADTFARGLLVAEKILTESKYNALRKERYASFDSGEGKRFETGELTLEALASIGMNHSNPKRISGKQELFENLINQFI